MKTVIKVFEIISIIGKAISTIICLIFSFSCFAASKTLIDEFIKSGSAKNEEEAKAALAVAAVFLIILAIYSILSLVLSVVTLVKLKNMTKKPIALGVLNILFASLISGICLLILDPASETSVYNENNYR